MTTTPTYRDELAAVIEANVTHRELRVDGERWAHWMEWDDAAQAVAARVLADAIAILRAHLWGIAASELREAFRERGIEVGE